MFRFVTSCCLIHFIDFTHLSASDVDASDQSPDSIFYEIVQTTMDGQLMLNGTTVLDSGDSFTQADLNTGRITYSNQSVNAVSDGFSYTLKDGGEDSAGSTSGELAIGVYEPLLLAGAESWSVVEQGVLTLTPEHVTTVGGFTPNNDLLIEINLPSNSTWFVDTRSGIEITRFTMDEVVGGVVQLHHDGSEPATDSVRLALYRTDIDNQIALDTRSIDLQILDLADAPTASDSVMFTDHLTPLTITAAQIGFADGDDGDILKAIRIVEVPESGSLYSNGVVIDTGSLVPVSVLEQGLLRYLPDSLVAGTVADDFVFAVIDTGDLETGGDNESIQLSTVTVTVVSNHSVIAHPDNITVPEAGIVSTLTSGSLTVAANDVDLDTPISSLSIELVSGPQHGTLELNSDGSFLYAHNGTETLDDIFSYRIFDPDQSVQSSIGEVLIQIIPQNDIPVAGNAENQVAVTTEILRFALPDKLFTDVDDNELSLSKIAEALPDVPDELPQVPVQSAAGASIKNVTAILPGNSARVSDADFLTREKTKYATPMPGN